MKLAVVVDVLEATAVEQGVGREKVFAAIESVASSGANQNAIEQLIVG